MSLVCFISAMDLKAASGSYVYAQLRLPIETSDCCLITSDIEMNVNMSTTKHYSKDLPRNQNISIPSEQFGGNNSVPCFSCLKVISPRK